MPKRPEVPDRDSSPTFITIPDVPEFYVNSSSIVGGLYDFLFEFGMGYPDGKIIPNLKIRMSPQHAWVMLQFFKRTMDNYIEKVGVFDIPEQFLIEKKLAEEYREFISKRKLSKEENNDKQNEN